MGTPALAPQRWLLFDGSCAKCSAIAAHIRTAIPARLHTMGLGDERAARLLAAANPAWTWEPTLVEQRGHAIRSYRGRSLVLRLALLLGPVRAWNAHRFARRHDIALSEIVRGIGRGPETATPPCSCADGSPDHPRGAEVLQAVRSSDAYRDVRHALAGEHAVDLWYDDEQRQHIVTFALEDGANGAERLAAFAVDLAGRRVVRSGTLVVETTPSGWRATNAGAAATAGA